MRETTKRVSEEGSLSRLRPTSHGASSEERAARFRQPLAAADAPMMPGLVSGAGSKRVSGPLHPDV